MFGVDQARAIVAYLQLMSQRDDFARPTIEQALANYWTARANPADEPMRSIDPERPCGRQDQHGLTT